MKNPSSNTKVLGSDWQGLSDFLVARIWEVENKNGGAYGPLSEQLAKVIVRAAVTDGNLDQVSGWHSPFEQSGDHDQAGVLWSAA